MHVEQFSSVNNLAVKHVHLTVVQVLCVYLTIVYGKNDGAHVRSMPKRSLFWQLGRHDHLGLRSTVQYLSMYQCHCLFFCCTNGLMCTAGGGARGPLLWITTLR